MAQPFTTLLDFAPDEVYRSGCVTAAEVGSYPAVSPFPIAGLSTKGGLLSVALSVPPPKIKRRPRVLPGIAPCGVRTFLPGSSKG